MQTKIRKEHYSRKAYIYIRQSTMDQVYNNHESRRIQYQLEDRAKDLGWQYPVIIDEDLGRSGSGTVERTGFSRLINDVIEHIVGAVFCVEASRIARNNREWYQLIDHCATVDTLLIDRDGIYDPNNLSDRIFLGMKGTMSEYELGIFRQRAQTAILEKAKRGELYHNLPAGYILTSDKRCEMSPDQRIQDAIHLTFSKFHELGSANQVVSWYRTENISVPCRTKQGDIIWKLPTISTIEKVLKNPIYAGAYAYGRSKTEIKIENGVPRKIRRSRLPIDQWKVLIQNHHPSYISWDEYMSNQKRLSENMTKNGMITKGAPKNGSALLTGLLRCKRCGQKLRVYYNSTRPGNPRYKCRDQATTGQNENCINFYGQSLEHLITEQILRVVQPAAISAAEQVEALLSKKHQQKQQSQLNALKQAEYEANRCFEQYNLVDPKNRLVASNLENQWDEALQQVERIKQQLEQIQKECQSLTEQDRKQLYNLAENLTDVWNHPKADNRIKKRIIQTLIEEIIVDIAEDNNIIAFIHWSGGSHTEHRIKRRRKGQRSNHLHPDTKKIVQGLAALVGDHEIARILNLQQIKTASGKNWNSIRVSNFRHQHHIPVFNQDDYDKKGWVNLTQAAEILGTFPMTIRRLIKAGILKARQVIQYSPWIIEKEQLETPQVLQAIQKLMSGKKNALAKNQAELNL
ncbi:MAG: recombinase family protein [bacterium]|nr:MAG: recombinase family protein [bacterium]